MPAVSKAQQHFMGMVHAAQQGGTPASAKVAKAASSMSDKSAKDFASTSTKGLPDKVKEIVLAEMRSVRTIQTEYSKVLDTIQQTLQSYKASTDDNQRKKFVDNLKKLGEVKKKLAKELDDSVSDLYKDAELKVVDEVTASDAAGPYNTPNAFAKPGDDEKAKGKHQASLTGYTLVEANSINEMGMEDVNVSKIVAMYDKGGNYTKKKVAATVCHDPNVSRDKVMKQLAHCNHQESVEYAHKLGL